MERSYEKITKKDLKKVLDLAKNDIEEFFKKYPKYGEVYSGSEVLVALGQGAALHYINGRNGIKDFDVWFFYPKKKITLPYRRRGKVDYGLSRFGKHPNDKDYNGRRIDVLMRSDVFFNSGKPEDCLINYLSERNTSTSKLLSKKAMIGLWPDQLFGKILWPSEESMGGVRS